MDENQNNKAGGILLTLVCIAAAYFGVQWWLDRSLVRDAIREYEMVKRNGGGAMELCLEAGVVAQAFLGIGDESNYQKWLAVERDDCSRAGLR